jgi:hypothetical protein
VLPDDLPIRAEEEGLLNDFDVGRGADLIDGADLDDPRSLDILLSE